MEKKVIIDVLRSLGRKFISYFKSRLLNKLKDGFMKALASFKETLWEEVKGEVIACAQEVVADAKKFFESEEAKNKEDVIVEAVMAKVKLPFVVKPFRGIIKRILKTKIEETVQNLLSKVDGILN